MSDFIQSTLNEIGFYFTAIKFLLYFFIGALILVCINKLLSIINLVFSRFSKEQLIIKIKYVTKVIVFILFSTFIGWLITFSIF